MSHQHRGDRRSSVSRWNSLLIVLLLAVIPAQAESPNRPFWVEQAMFRFGEDLFFVGQASCAKTAEEGRQKAFTQGLQELLNYAQASSPTGVEIATQMVFEEANTTGCPSSTVTVWRLLRVDTDKVTKLTKTARFRPRPDAAIAAASPRDLTPKIGMSRDEILERFGRPWSVLMRGSSAEIVWEYPRFGLALMFNKDNYVKGWRLAAPQEQVREKKGESVGEKGLSTDLTNRLKQLEQEPETRSNIAYNSLRFSQPNPRSQPPVTFSPQITIHSTISSRPFSPTTQSVTSLAVGEYPNGLKISRSVTPRCDFAQYHISLWHLKEATGPQISTDYHLNDSANSELLAAVMLAAKTIGYDPRFIGVRLSIYMPIFPILFSENATIDTTGAEMAFAVTVASALLGDTVRSDVSMFGTLDRNLATESVDGLEDKLSGCRLRPLHELVLSAGQNLFDPALSRMGEGIKATHVSTLAEAYEVATGQPLRRAQ